MQLTDTIQSKPRLDILLLLVSLALLGVGLLLIYSADNAQDIRTHFNRQLLFSLFGLVPLIMLTAVPPRLYYSVAYFIYGFSLFMLLLVAVLGVTGFGAQRWLNIGGFRFQPSEPAKLALILAISRFLSDNRGPHSSWRIVGIVAILGLIPFGFVVLQPDLGTSTVFPIICFGLLAWYGLSLKYFLAIMLPIITPLVLIIPWIFAPLVVMAFLWLKREGMRWLWMIVLGFLCLFSTIAAPLAWSHLKPYQQKRLTTFLNPTEDPLGAGYQVIQSQVAIGSGGLYGTGYLKGTQTQLRFLPQQHTDFIFSLAGEEFGFFGTSGIIFLYFIFCWRGFVVSAYNKNPFLGNISAGLTIMILYHILVNIGMTLGNLPVTGLPLPFLSYGGSFLLVCLSSVGIILSVGLRRRGY